jgi:hypothetical protein
LLRSDPDPCGSQHQQHRNYRNSGDYGTESNRGYHKVRACSRTAFGSIHCRSKPAETIASLASLSRSSGVSVAWDPQSYSADDVLSVDLFATGKILVCTAPAVSGKFSFPPDLLQQMPPTESVDLFYRSSLSLFHSSPDAYDLPASTC